MTEEQKPLYEKLKLLGEKLRAGAAELRPVPKQVIEQALNPVQKPAQEKKPEEKKIKLRRRRRRFP